MAEFLDRFDAGQQLAESLRPWRGRDVVVLGIARGGVPVADVVARVLDAPLDVVMVRKLGEPGRPELAMGAIGEQGARILHEWIIDDLGITPDQLSAAERQEQEVLQDRASRFREGRERVELAGRTVVIVDDGIATGATARAACLDARHQGAARVVLAAPVADREAVGEITEADEVVVLFTPRDFRAVGVHYQDFSQTADEEVVAILDAAGRRRRQRPDDTDKPPRTDLSAAPGAGLPEPPPLSMKAHIPAAHVALESHFTLPSTNAPVVVFAQGSGSSRHSRRNRYAASVLQEAGLGTLVLDLLTPEEEADRSNAFEIGMLAQRLTAAEAWVHRQPQSMSSPVGFFGASTGAGAALWAAAEPGARVGAVVSRGGRPDLAAPRLKRVRAPTLLIVGGQDHQVLERNRQAQAQLRCESRLQLVKDATHLFEELDALEETAQLARDWFLRHLPVADVLDPEAGP